MPTSTQEIAALGATLDVLEMHLKTLRERSSAATQDSDPTPLHYDLDSLTAEGEMVAALIESLTKRLNGTTEDAACLPPWPPFHNPEDNRAVTQVGISLHEMHRWLQKARMYLIFLAKIATDQESGAQTVQPSIGADIAFPGKPFPHPATEFGQYVGRLILEPLKDGRRMAVAQDFSFVDSKQKVWPVPKGTHVDGASIPQPLWSVMGGPFEGKYRDASVIHDYHCSTRLHPHREVHRVFYDAMRASGVSTLRAKVMYAAVYFAGPKWTEMDVVNTRLPRPDGAFEKAVIEAIEVPDFSQSSVLKSVDGREPDSLELQFNLQKLERAIEAHDPDLAEIESAVDQVVQAIQTPFSNADLMRALWPPRETNKPPK